MAASAIPATAATVTVACNLPHGIRLQLQRKEVQKVMGFGGQMGAVDVYRHFGKTVVLNGNAVAAKEAPKNPIECGYALTFGVDAEFMAQWLEQNAELEAVRNKCIMIHHKTSELSAIVKENEGRKTGLEPMNPNALPVMGIKTFNRSDARTA